MIYQRSYNESLLCAVGELKTGCDELGGLALSLIFFEDTQNGSHPFVDGDEIPLDLALLKASDIPSVKIINEVFLEMDRVFASLCNINSISSEYFQQDELPYEELIKQDPPYPVGARDTFDDLKLETGNYISYVMLYILSNCYSMLNGAEPSDDILGNFYFPEDETYAMLASDDFNVNELLTLVKFLHEKREEAWAA